MPGQNFKGMLGNGGPSLARPRPPCGGVGGSVGLRRPVGCPGAGPGKVLPAPALSAPLRSACLVGPPPRPSLGGGMAPPLCPVRLVRRASPRLWGVIRAPWSLARPALCSASWGRPRPLRARLAPMWPDHGSPQPPSGWGQSRRLRPSAAWPRSRRCSVAFGSRPSLVPPGAGAGQAPPFSGLRPRACPCRGKGQGRLSLGAEGFYLFCCRDVPPF